MVEMGFEVLETKIVARYKTVTNESILSKKKF